MARSMRLFLIRHGETVDNVAQLYAGSRDSELTNHGYQQATRLGLHFKTLGLSFTHLFSSHLQRAAKTAGKIREAQLASTRDESNARAIPDVVKLPVLMEQDFGSMEGKKWHDRPPEAKVSGKEHHQQGSKDTAGFVNVESKDAMAQRADAFLDEHLLPLLDGSSEPADLIVAIVSHGIFLSTVWKCLLLRLPPKSVSLCLETQATPRPSLEHLGGWSNTGYLELHMTKVAVEEPSSTAVAAPDLAPQPSSSSAATSAADGGIGDVAAAELPALKTTTPSATPAQQSASMHFAHGWMTRVLTINGKDHLKGFKRTGGGVGSSRHDASQKSIETFFKRRKVE